VAHHGTHVHGEPQLELGRLPLDAVVQLEGGGHLLEQLIEDSGRRGVRWHHGQEAVAAIFGLRVRKVLHSRLRHLEKHFPDQQTITVGTAASAEIDYIGEEDSTVLSV
jgi:hypothetical protein